MKNKILLLLLLLIALKVPMKAQEKECPLYEQIKSQRKKFPLETLELCQELLKKKGVTLKRRIGTYLVQANIEAEMGDYRQAVESITQSHKELMKGQREGNKEAKKLEYYVAFNAGRIHRLAGNENKAAYYFSLAMDTSLNRWKVKNQLVLLAIDNQEYDRAERLLEVNEQQARAAGDSSKLWQAVINKGYNYLQQGKGKTAVEYSKQAMLIGKGKVAEENPLIMGNLLSNLGHGYLLTGEREKAVTYLELARGYGDRLGNVALQEEVLESLPGLYEQLGAIEKENEALKAYQKVKGNITLQKEKYRQIVEAQWQKEKQELEVLASLKHSKLEQWAGSWEAWAMTLIIFGLACAIGGWKWIESYKMKRQEQQSQREIKTLKGKVHLLEEAMTQENHRIIQAIELSQDPNAENVPTSEHVERMLERLKSNLS